MEKKRMNEEKRNKVGWIVFAIATVVIIVVAAFFIASSVVQNPLEGEWNAKDAGYYLDIDDEGDADLTVTIADVPVEVDLYYTMDKNAKTVTFEAKMDSFADAAEDTNNKLAAADIDEYLTEFLTAYDYSVETGKLTLTERESGEQFIFTRVK